MVMHNGEACEFSPTLDLCPFLSSVLRLGGPWEGSMGSSRATDDLMGSLLHFVSVLKTHMTL